MKFRHGLARKGFLAACALQVALLSGCGGGGGGAATGPTTDGTRVSELKVVSGRPDLVSGGDALVAVTLSKVADAARLKVTLGDADVTSKFALRGNGKIQGLVDGLTVGENKLTATIDGANPVSITLVNHPKGGPIFSGPQKTPWICMTEQNGLGPAQDAQCNAPVKVEYFYRSSDAAKPGFLKYDPENPAKDVATTTTDRGIKLPYIVRRERGTLNRSVYDIAVLAEPGKEVSPFNPPSGWNNKLYYVFWGGAAPQHIQGLIEPIGTSNAFLGQPGDVVTVEKALSLGFATASSSGNVFGYNANSVTSAEVMMMVKERVAKSLGEIRYTLSQGASGGSMQQHLIANAYPGLLDGILPAASYQDIHTTNNEVQDCSLLLRYFDANPSTWGDVTQQNAVTDNSNELPGTCRSWVASYALDRAWMDPIASCYIVPPGGSPGFIGVGSRESWMYDPIANPKGERCGLFEYQVNIFGKRSDGFANRAYDNVGIQYGLKAVRAGKISPEQFVDLNERVGGRDIDWGWTAQRSVADTAGLQNVYRSGQVNLGTGLASIPVIDLRLCTNTEIHSCFHSWVTRERLIKANGQANNHVILFARGSDGFAPADPEAVAAMGSEALTLLDRWVSEIKADTTTDSDAVKVSRHRPSEAQDACWINGVRTTDMTACQAALPRFGDPRTGSGASQTVDVMKCQLRSLERASYGVSFTDTQWARLQAAFPEGACDWSAPSVGQTTAVPWLSYAGGAGGQPLGKATAATKIN